MFKMKTPISILLISINSLCYSQKTPCYQQKIVCDKYTVANCHNLVSFDEEKNTYYSKKNLNLLYTGNCVTCHRNGQLESQISIVNGKQDSLGLGISIAYYESGCVQSKLLFISGNLEGEAIFYFDSTGNKAQIENFKNGLLNGKSIQFDNNPTNDTLEFTSYKNNQLDGLKKEFYPDNKVRRSAEYKNGVQHGIQKSFSKDGIIEMEIEFLNGKKHGEWRYYFNTGMLATIQNWNSGQKDGEFKAMDEKGTILLYELYTKGIPNGTHFENDSKGMAKHVVVFNKKGERIEEYSFDEFGIKKVIIERIEKEKKGKKKGKKI